VEVSRWLPYEGKVQLLAHEDGSYSFRLPSWVREGQAKLEIEGQEQKMGLEGEYAQIGAMKAGQRAVVSFPVRREEIKEFINDPDPHRVHGVLAGEHGGGYRSTWADQASVSERGHG
jgi:DUF1680 family protein